MADLLKNLEIVHPAAAALSPEDFALLRRQGLGASDASIYLGLQTKWRNTEDLIRNKLAVTLTEEEKMISKKVAVRLGHATEDTNLAMFSEIMELTAAKDPAMYRHKTYPYLTINFDGICIENDMLIPVEAKFVSKYAKKYWRRPLRVTSLQDAVARMRTIEVQYHTKIEEHIRLCAEDCGIPPYYYTQVQQQLLALNAPFGYLTSLWDAGWESNTFLIPRDLITQHALVTRAEHVWKQIKGQV